MKDVTAGLSTHASNKVAHVRSIPLDLIDDDGNDMRRVVPSAWSDATLTSSISHHGLLQPIGARPKGERFAIVFGRRRLRCARTAGLEHIAVDVRDWTDDEVRAVQVTENMQREAPHPIDVWRSVCDLVDAGATHAEASREIGLDDRTARQMERLGRMCPELLKLIEIEMPDDRDLRAIANAPIKIQRAAAKQFGKPTTGWNGTLEVAWRSIRHACNVKRIPRTRAIFDADAHPELWHEDLFAQPDDDDRFTTSYIGTFMTLQQAALEARVEQQRSEKRRVQLAAYSTTSHGVTLPKGFKLISASRVAKPQKTECVFTAVRPDGTIAEALAVDVAAQKATDKQRDTRAKEKAKATAPAAGDAQAAADDDADDALAPAAEAKPAFSKAGVDLIAAAKTAALRKTLREGIAELPLERLVALLLLALTADNIELRLDSAAGPSDDDDDGLGWEAHQDRRHLRDIARRLLLPGGGLADLSAADMRRHAGEALARILGASGSTRRTYGDSGAAAEWIGAAIRAGDALPRFDTKEFLATVNGETLRATARANGVKDTGTVAAVRERLAGTLPNWRPDAGQFGAPAPTPRDKEDD